MTDATDGKLRRYRELAKVFTPNAPINSRDLFRGRIDQIFEISSAVSQPGKHVVLYGERGVGKTSLANILTELLADDIEEAAPSTARINCTTQDNFLTIWTKSFRELRIPPPAEWEKRPPDPDDIRWTLQSVSPGRILVLDEFDRVEDDEALSLMSDTLKSLSDHQVATKVVVVGVADSLDQLIGEHESVQRAVEEVSMPRMSESEIYDVIDKGLQTVGMAIEDGARSRIARLCQGLPHYAHLLTLHAGQHAVLDDRQAIAQPDVQRATAEAVRKHSLAREYQTAIQSSRTDALFRHVLAACALADKNRLGYFTAGAVREPMSRIMGKRYEIPAFAPHLDAFTNMDRGSVLQKEGPPRRYVYRFRNPLLQPFAILTALSEDVIPTDYSDELFG